MANVLPPFTTIKRAALDLLFPRWCLGCGREGEFLCVSCRRTMSEVVPPVCSRCGRPCPPETSCPGCSDWPENLDGVRAPFRFEGLIRHAIHQFKYSDFKAIAPMFASMLYDYLTENPLPGDTLVPVPLHPLRWRERGYNQSELVAGELGKLSGLSVTGGSLVRSAVSPPQARSANVNQRRRNVAGAFHCVDGRLRDRQVILIDDVSTSGATLGSCARALKAAGATTVWGLVIALEL